MWNKLTSTDTILGCLEITFSSTRAGILSRMKSPFLSQMIHKLLYLVSIMYVVNSDLTTAMLDNTKSASNLSTNENSPCCLMTNDTEDDTEDDEDQLSLASKITYGIVIPIMAVVCVIGNILTIVSYVQDRKLRTVHNTYLISLAVADLLIGCVSMPFYAAYTLKSYQWPFGVAFCKVYSSIDYMACLESVFVIMLVSYDRVMLLLQGATYSVKQTIKLAKVRLAVSWTLAFLVYVPAIVFWDVIRGHTTVAKDDCDVEFANEVSYTMATALFEFFIPIIVISSLNIYLYSLIRKHSRESPGKKSLSKNAKSVELKEDDQSTSAHDAKQKSLIHVIRRERKAARSLAILVSVFTVCWMPYTVCTVIIAFCDKCVSDNLYEAFAWLLWGNSTLNSFLYAFTNKQFRLNYIRLLKLEKCCSLRAKIAPLKSQTIYNTQN